MAGRERRAALPVAWVASFAGARQRPTIFGTIGFVPGALMDFGVKFGRKPDLPTGGTQ
jgi:hypothetical protein